MSTLASTITNVRIRIRENKTNYFSDADFIVLANDTIKSFFDSLVGVECKLVMESSQQTLTAAITDYTLTGIVSIVPLHVYINSSPIPVYDPMKPEEVSYKQNATGITFYNHSDDDVANVDYWGPLPVLTDVNETLPWDGDWDQAIMRALVVETKEVRDKQVNNVAALATIAYEQALSLSVTKHGSVPRMIKGTL
jgi:uncharacterized protein YneR